MAETNQAHQERHGLGRSIAYNGLSFIGMGLIYLFGILVPLLGAGLGIFLKSPWICIAISLTGGLIAGPAHLAQLDTVLCSMQRSEYGTVLHASATVMRKLGSSLILGVVYAGALSRVAFWVGLNWVQGDVLQYLPVTALLSLVFSEAWFALLRAGGLWEACKNLIPWFIQNPVRAILAAAIQLGWWCALVATFPFGFFAGIPLLQWLPSYLMLRLRYPDPVAVMPDFARDILGEEPGHDLAEAGQAVPAEAAEDILPAENADAPQEPAGLQGQEESDPENIVIPAPCLELPEGVSAPAQRDEAAEPEKAEALPEKEEKKPRRRRKKSEASAAKSAPAENEAADAEKDAQTDVQKEKKPRRRKKSTAAAEPEQVPSAAEASQDSAEKPQRKSRASRKKKAAAEAAAPADAALPAVSGKASQEPGEPQAAEKPRRRPAERKDRNGRRERGARTTRGRVLARRAEKRRRAPQRLSRSASA